MQASMGILPVIPTPFRDGRFDENSFLSLLEHMLPWVDGYTVLGSTGESPSMTANERKDIARFALAHTPREKKVIVGVSSTSSQDAALLAQHAEEHGACGVLCAAPYYFDNVPDGVLDFLRQVDAAINVDLILYDNPAATKTWLSANDVWVWSEQLKHLRAVKLTDHNLSKVRYWQDHGLLVIGGDDPILFHYLAAGVDGVMMIAPAIFPESFRLVWDTVQAGETDAAFRIFAQEILPFVHAFGIGTEIATTKGLLEDVGIFASGEIRPPLRMVDGDRRKVVRQAFEMGVEAARARAAVLD